MVRILYDDILYWAQDLFIVMRGIFFCAITVMVAGCTTIIQPARVVIAYHPPPPVAVYSHTEFRPEVYYFSTRTPVVVYKEHHVYRHHPYRRRW
jgi:hypothetical protein